MPSDEEGTILCVVQRGLGGGFLEVLCTDNQVYKAWIPGKMRRRRAMWIREGDVILFLPWGTRDNKGEVVYRYKESEVRELADKGLIDEELLGEAIE